MKTKLFLTLRLIAFTLLISSGGLLFSEGSYATGSGTCDILGCNNACNYTTPYPYSDFTACSSNATCSLLCGNQWCECIHSDPNLISSCKAVHRELYDNQIGDCIEEFGAPGGGSCSGTGGGSNNINY